MRELERDHAGDDEAGAEPAPEAAGVAEEPHPHEEGSGGADAGPHRVGGAERDVPLRQKQQAAADRERDDRHRRAEDGPPRILRPLQADRPADLAQSGGNQICPGDRHVLRPLPLAIRGTIAKDDSRFVTAGSASASTAGGAELSLDAWKYVSEFSYRRNMRHSHSAMFNLLVNAFALPRLVET